MQINPWTYGNLLRMHVFNCVLTGWGAAACRSRGKGGLTTQACSRAAPHGADPDGVTCSH